MKILPAKAETAEQREREREREREAKRRVKEGGMRGWVGGCGSRGAAAVATVSLETNPFHVPGNVRSVNVRGPPFVVP